MTQEALVIKLLPKGMAEVLVVRGTACGSNCGNCESCMYQNELKTQARNLIGARPGQKVIIESKTSMVFGAAMLVYVMPMILFLLGYALAYSLGAAEGLCVAASFIGLMVGAAIIVISQRMKKEKTITFDIVRLEDGVEAE